MHDVEAGPGVEAARSTTEARAWHARSAADALADLRSGADGIADEEAARRRLESGANELPRARPRSAWRILLDQVRSVVVVLLAAALLVAAVAGDLPEAVAIAAVLVLNTTLGFFTELRARRAMDALLALEAPHATVVRDGVRREVAARELVPGDVIELEAGQAAPADARLVMASELRVTEAALTGESLPVEKDAGRVLAAETPLADRVNMLFQSSVALSGRARAVVVATGAHTELGRIGALVESVEESRTPLERRLDQLGRRLIAVALAAGGVVAAIGALRGEDLALIVETGLALAIAAVPEGLPAVATVAMAIGVRRMARRHALVRRLPVVEALGSTTVICTDKTGTLTSGEMTVTALWADGAARELPADVDLRADHGLEAPAAREALRVAVLCNRADLGGDAGSRRGDPTEIALLDVARRAGMDRDAELARLPETGELPFSSERQLMATFHRAEGGIVAMLKGAPARVLARCDALLLDGERVPLDEETRALVQAENDRLAAAGLRVLALASGPVREASEAGLRQLTLAGLAGMSDPLAPGVADTLGVLRAAGIHTVMITGDQRRTAMAIAGSLGMLEAGDEVLDGAESARLSDDELQARSARIRVVSRISPEDKLRLVRAHQRRGEVVAMLGDGVNDAPALKRADIGVAMGRRGTDVAKQAAGVVLQDDRFATISAAVEEGRVIFDNIRKFVFYLFSCNLAEVLILVGASVASLPLPLLPLQILWLNLVTDTAPALALAFEPAEDGVMRQPPRDPRAAILSSRMLARIGVYALLITLATLAAFLVALRTTGDARRAVTWSFATLSLAQLLHLGNARSSAPVLAPSAIRRNPIALGAVLLTIALTVAAVQAPPLARLLGTQPLSLGEWAVVGALGALPAVIGQAWKMRRRRPA